MQIGSFVVISGEELTSPIAQLDFNFPKGTSSEITMEILPMALDNFKFVKYREAEKESFEKGTKNECKNPHKTKQQQQQQKQPQKTKKQQKQPFNGRYVF